MGAIKLAKNRSIAALKEDSLSPNLVSLYLGGVVYYNISRQQLQLQIGRDMWEASIAIHLFTPNNTIKIDRSSSCITRDTIYWYRDTSTYQLWGHQQRPNTVRNNAIPRTIWALHWFIDIMATINRNQLQHIWIVFVLCWFKPGRI